jgi:hypothetical protein
MTIGPEPMIMTFLMSPLRAMPASSFPSPPDAGIPLRVPCLRNRLNPDRG